MGTTEEIHAILDCQVAVVVAGDPNSDHVAVRRNEITIDRQLILVGDFGERLDERRDYAGVVPEILVARNDDLWQILARIDVRMNSIPFLKDPTRRPRA